MPAVEDTQRLESDRATPSSMTAARGSRSSTRRLAVNIAPAERVGRVLLGGLAALAGAILLTSAGSVLAVILEVLLIVAGLDLVVTGALGHCPLYHKLGYTPTSLRRPS
jgi:hypothetical protein